MVKNTCDNISNARSIRLTWIGKSIQHNKMNNDFATGVPTQCGRMLRAWLNTQAMVSVNYTALY